MSRRCRWLLLCLLLGLAGCMEGTKPEPLKRTESKTAESRQP